MGADLIVWVMFGPNKFTKTQVKAARKIVEEQLGLLKEIVNIQNYEPDKRDLPDVEDKLEELEGQLGSSLKYEYDNGEDYESLSHRTTDQILHHIHEAWSGEYRDIAIRGVPNPTRGGIEKVVVAGEMSWGDEPDGEGYQGLKMISLFDLEKILGVC